MSESNGWTPGPWEVKNTADIFTPLGATNAEGIEAAANDGWHIADCDMGGLGLGELRANAHLIAAAPDLYEALEEAAGLLAFLSSHLTGRMGDAALYEMKERAMEWLGVLDRARGEQS